MQTPTPLVLHVSPTGDDRACGGRDAPLRGPFSAQARARAHAGRGPVTIVFADGVYPLPETLVFTPEDSGTVEAPVEYRAENEGRAVLSGGLELRLQWRPFRSGIFVADTPAGISFDQLFVNGRRQTMARYPNHDPNARDLAYGGCAADALAPARVARWSNPAGGYIHAMHRARWGGYHYRITGKNADGTLAYKGGWQNNRQMGMHPEQRMVENIFEELDAEGEWFHDPRAGRLYFFPPRGVNLAEARIEVVRLAHLVEFQGSAAAPVQGITLSGFVFRHAARTFMENREPLLRSDWTIYRGGAVLFRGARRCELSDCVFDQPGGNAVFVDGWNRELRIRGTHFHEVGASAVAFVGSASAARSPLFEYGRPRDWEALDRAPGPASDDYPADCVVEDCLMQGVGRVEKQAAGVQISLSARITVRHCTIHDASRAGININEGTFGGHLIEGCDVFDTVLETHDHGSFNSWGRDRFWVPDIAEINTRVAADPNLPFLDTLGVTIIRRSRWRCDHGWDIDLDDGSSHYEITENLLLHGGLKLREGYHRVVTNNVIVGNSLHPHVWLHECGDVFARNIVMCAYQPALMPESGRWGRELNHNFFACPAADRDRYAVHGADRDSLAGDPRFVDPAAGDYRVREDSPALAVGFRNFPMHEFGVRKPALRALARRPVLPELRLRIDGASASADHTAWLDWMGGRLRDLEGEEFSAFGVARDTGGLVVVSAPPGSALCDAGIAPRDLLVSAAGQTITRVPDLERLLARHPAGAPLTLVAIRRQQTREFTLRSPARQS